MWADYGQDLVAKSSSAPMRPMSLSSINCHGSCRSRSLPVPAVAATVAQASAALTGTEPLGRFAGRRGLGERDSRPLREAVGELVAAIPFSLKPVHGRTCPGCGPRKRTNRRPLTSSRPQSRATCTPGAYRDTAPVGAALRGRGTNPVPAYLVTSATATAAPPGCSSSGSTAARAADQRRPARAAAEAGGALAGAHLGGRGRGAGGHYQEGASRGERALVRRSPRSTVTGACPVPAPAGGHRSPQRIGPRRARLIPADCRPAGSASLSLRAAAHRGRATGHHRR